MAVTWVDRKPDWGETVDWNEWGMPAPAADWRFDDGTGALLNDASGNGNHGTFAANAPAWTSTQYGSGLDFDGSNDHVILPNVFATVPYTLAVRFRADALSGNSKFLWTANAAGDAAFAHILYINSGASWVLTHAITTNTATNRRGATAISAGGWYTAVVTVPDTTGAGISIYLDGALDLGTSQGTSMTAPAGNHSIGGKTFADDRNFDGQIDTLRVWRQVLDPGQAATISREGPTPIWSPQRYWYAGGGAVNYYIPNKMRYLRNMRAA